jgi:DNA polymerase III psi subunit
MNPIPAEVLFTEELYQFESRTVVVVSEPWELISADDRELLQKILQAVRLSTDAVTIVQRPVLDIKEIRPQPLRVIHFGAGADRPLYEPTTIDGVPVVLSVPLDQLHADATAKQKLWTGLKVLFSR